MKVKLYFRVALLTGMLFVLVSTFKTQPCAACSPGWYEGCVSGCENASCSWHPMACLIIEQECKNKCAQKLAACYAD
jgi:muramidase (phage lysozyme)